MYFGSTITLNVFLSSAFSKRIFVSPTNLAVTSPVSETSALYSFSTEYVIGETEVASIWYSSSKFSVFSVTLNEIKSASSLSQELKETISVAINTILKRLVRVLIVFLF